MLTALSSIFFVFYTQSVSPSAHGNFYELYAIAAAVLGGCSLRGGEGSIVGIVLGTVLLQVLQNLVNILGIPSSLNFAVMGAVILLGVIADRQLQAGASTSSHWSAPRPAVWRGAQPARRCDEGRRAQSGLGRPRSERPASGVAGQGEARSAEHGVLLTATGSRTVCAPSPRSSLSGASSGPASTAATAAMGACAQATIAIAADPSADQTGAPKSPLQAPAALPVGSAAQIRTVDAGSRTARVTLRNVRPTTSRPRGPRRSLKRWPMRRSLAARHRR